METETGKADRGKELEICFFVHLSVFTEEWLIWIKRDNRTLVRKDLEKAIEVRRLKKGKQVTEGCSSTSTMSNAEEM